MPKHKVAKKKLQTRTKGADNTAKKSAKAPAVVETPRTRSTVQDDIQSLRGTVSELTKTVSELSNAVSANSQAMAAGRPNLPAPDSSVPASNSHEPEATNGLLNTRGVSADELPHVDVVSPAIESQILSGKDVNLAALLIPNYVGEIGRAHV